MEKCGVYYTDTLFRFHLIKLEISINHMIFFYILRDEIEYMALLKTIPYVEKLIIELYDRRTNDLTKC